MAQSSTKKKPIGAMIVMGVISIALYAGLLLKQNDINSTFAQGGWYALLPIITAFVFSYFHGGFTGHFWTVLGIEAARKKKEVK
jgi:drug/metabolite transporter (DMT)-like permease